MSALEEIRIREDISMPKIRPKQLDGRFGERLAKLRKEAGYSQRALAAELGISNRVVAYYEGETDHPPSSLLVPLAKLLGVSTDVLLGVKPMPRKKRQRDARLWRRFNQIERLPASERRHLVHVIDTFLENAKLKEHSE